MGYAILKLLKGQQNSSPPSAPQNAVSSTGGMASVINLADPDKTAPLLEAIVNFHFDLAAYLLDHGADPNACDIHGRCALYAAVDMHRLDTSTRPNPVLSDKLDSLNIIKFLLAHKANPNAQLIEPVPPRGPLDVADYTMGEGATPFLRAAKAADLEVMRLLLAKGADPLQSTKAGVTPLMAAAGVGWRDGKSHGTESDAIEAIKICLDHGAKINTATGKGQTALHGASVREANDVVAFLVSHGANPNAKDDKGHRALGMVVQTFSAKVPAEGTRTPASLACDACTGTLSATSTAPWLVITSTDGGQIAFNVLPNPTQSPRSATIQVAGTTNKVTVTITQSPAN
jgi:ankyrin repeat protein